MSLDSKKILELLRSYTTDLGLDSYDIDLPLRDVGLDSYEILELILFLDSELGVKFPLHELNAQNTKSVAIFVDKYAKLAV